MGAFTSDELARIGDSVELQVSSRRRDGSLRPFVIIWGVRVGDDVFVRSAYGPDNGWFRRALASKSGRIRVDGLERDVTFEHAGAEVQDAVDDAYQAKYGARYPKIVGSVVGPAVHDLTIRVGAA